MTEENQVSEEVKSTPVASEEFYAKFFKDSIEHLKNLEQSGDLKSTVQLFINEKHVVGYKPDEPDKQTVFVLVSLSDNISFFVDADRLNHLIVSELKDTPYKTLLDSSINVVDDAGNKMKGSLLVIYNGETNQEMITFVEQTKKLMEKKNEQKPE